MIASPMNLSMVPFSAKIFAPRSVNNSLRRATRSVAGIDSLSGVKFRISQNMTLTVRFFPPSPSRWPLRSQTAPTLHRPVPNKPTGLPYRISPKNRVAHPDSLVTISVLNGELAIVAPAIKAAMPDPTDMCMLNPISEVNLSRFVPIATIAKHQDIAPKRIISGTLAIQPNAWLTTNRDKTREITTRRPIPRNENKIAVSSGFSRLGWSSVTVMAQISWKIGTVSDMRPGCVSSWKCS